MVLCLVILVLDVELMNGAVISSVTNWVVTVTSTL